MAAPPVGSPARQPDGHETPPFGELPEQAVEVGLDRAADQDDVERRVRRDAFGEVARVDVDAAEAEAGQPRLDVGPQRRFAFERNDAAGEAGEQRRRIAGAAADIEHLVRRLDASALDQPREDQRRQQVARLRGSARLRYQADIGIGEIAPFVGHEAFARDHLETREQALVGDVEGPDLAVDHRPAPGRRVVQIRGM